MLVIKKWVNENDDLLLEIYDKLHNLAEVSWKEARTREFLCSELDKIDLPYQTFEHHYGIVVTWKGSSGEGPTIALRADMDALWQNVDGIWKSNHSCGHDAHMAMVLNTLRCLKETNFQPLDGCLKVIFQPAEESGKGAKAIIDDGLVDDIDYLLGIHVRPKIEMRFGEVSPAIYHGAATLLKGRIKGIQAHGSRPNMGINVVDSLGAIIAAVNAVTVDPTIPSSAKVTQVKAGGDNINIIPDEGEFSIDLRAQTNAAMKNLIEKVTTAVKYAGQANGADVTVENRAQMVAAEPNRFMESIINEAICEVLGKNSAVTPPITPGGEDFHFYTKERKNIQATMIGLGTDLEPGLHHPKMHFNKNSLGNGVAILAASTILLFEKARFHN
ncbi:M20 peptidase aminoacylase family protein [Fictibacillus barbaricus]|uniref:M20 peptidase aminoacylase family protein n=1 Tax=Fictibacillus barbaricus TaxID=182136 RepID=A0ABS2Z9A8_9BACL|nr:M20 peptidase aminoacylase family protein [Fictibacillus barbaricus]MBN3544197.1 M20 peptidase aminoacylase family protein [Fictibacillus barbaricus]GGB69717.1 amidohydrolase AmhX [Fictibacillus barbaricus]